MASLGRTDYDFDKAWWDYRFGAFYNQWVGPQIARNLDYSSERAMELMGVLIPRTARHFADHGGADLIDELIRTDPR